jgi:hypothetical protein
MARRISTKSIKGGRKKSTNAEFANDVEKRLYGGNPTPRVALASSRNVPIEIVDEVNRRGGRNSLRTSPNGKMTAHEARYKELRAAFGLTTG